MIRPQLILDINHELFCDSFAGGGGASTGIELALGRHVDHAVNHDRFALGMHRINHAQTIHHCEDVFDIEPRRITEGRPVGASWFSPDCRHFSKAKGGKPLSKKIRGLAYVMFRWAAIRTRVMFMENVEEIQDWGPLYTDHSNGCKGRKECKKNCRHGRPIPEHKGRTWRAFRDVLERGIDPNHPDIPEMLEVLSGNTGKPGSPSPISKEQLVRGFGYHGEVNELRACDYGAPTIRKRLFGIWRCDAMPIVWPEPTHYNPKKPRPAGKGLKPWNIIADCIDWDLPCPSIFLTREQARLHNCRRPLATSTLRRIATGVDRFVLKAKKPFTVTVTHHGSERVYPCDEPANTVTAARRGEQAVVQPTVAPFVGDNSRPQSNKAAGADEPLRTATAGTKRGHFQVVTPILAHCAHGEQSKSGKRRGRGAHPVTEPSTSVLGSNDLALVSGTIVGAGGPARNGEPRPVDRVMHGLTTDNNSYLAGTILVNTTGHTGAPPSVPAPTIPTGGHHGVIAAHLTKFVTGSVGQQADEPLPTITAGHHAEDTHGGAASVHGVVAAHLVEYHSAKRPNDQRVKPVTEPLPVQTTEPRFAKVATNMVKLRGNPASHPSAPADEPAHTISAAGQHHSVSACYLAQHNGGQVGHQTYGHDARTPASTISAKGSQQQVVEASCINAYYGNPNDCGQPTDGPLRTVTTEERFNLTKATAVDSQTGSVPGLTPAQLEGARCVAAFLRAHGVQFEGEFATITVEGTAWIIVDIGMRMLTPRELFRAQGFPEHYVIDRAWLVNPKTGDIEEVTLTKEQQIRMCGNSVAPPVARAIVAANVPELGAWFKGERNRPTVRKQIAVAA